MVDTAQNSGGGARVPSAPSGAIREGNQLVISRQLPLSATDAWAAVTESEKMAAWYGPWEGQLRAPGSGEDGPLGEVSVTMIAEEGAPAMVMEVVSCAPGKSYRVRGKGHFAWDLGVEVEELTGQAAGAPARSQVSLVHALGEQDLAMVDQIGPGWEYYLDCLLVAVSGGDASKVDFGDYFPAQQFYYQLVGASEQALASIRAFESARHTASLLADADKPDKQTTRFVNTADLVWAWIAQHPEAEHSLYRLAAQVSGLEDQALIDAIGALVELWEFRDPFFVSLVDDHGGLTFRE